MILENNTTASKFGDSLAKISIHSIGYGDVVLLFTSPMC